MEPVGDTAFGGEVDHLRSRGNVNPTVFGIERDGMMHADHIITVSNLTRQTVIEKYGIDPAKVTTVHNAVIPLSQELLDVQVIIEYMASAMASISQ